jgi:hypothetical protein
MDEDYGVLYSGVEEEYRSLITPKTECIYLDCESLPINLDDFVRKQVRKVLSVLNILSNNNPAVFTFAAILDSNPQLRLLNIIDLEAMANLHRLRTQEYRLKTGVTRDLVSKTYRVIDYVCDHASQKIFITLDRFNSSLTRASWADKIIDITISLESLIEAKNELRFKFSLYLSFVVASTSVDRQNAFALLRDLYDARSAFVHGSSDSQKVIDKVINNWDEISQIVKAAINYYMFFLFSTKSISWNEHLNQLIFGLEKRIVD